MANDMSHLDLLVARVSPALAAAEGEKTQEPDATPSMRELFLELVVVSLGNLFGRTPLPSTLFDRATMRVFTEGVDDNEASKLTNRGEDWMRLEGIIRAAEGQKAYTLNRPTFAVLSTATAEGSLGEIMERITRCYAEQRATPEIRSVARELGAYFMTRIARS